MCISVLLWDSHPLYSLILLLNRDEYHNRPTDPLSWWVSEDDHPILGGRDALAGGTWLACTRDGRLAFLTNVRELPSPSKSKSQPKSRGHLPVRFLKSNRTPKDFAEELMQEADDYDGFNLMVADLCSLSMVYITNRGKGAGITAKEVSPGVHVLSNATLDTPWPKAQRLERSFKDIVEEYGEKEIPLQKLPEKLMRDTTKDDDESKLPHIYPLEWEHHLSSIFVDTETPMGRYGTRSTSVVSVQYSGLVNFQELYLDKESWKESSISFQLEKLKKIE